MTQITPNQTLIETKQAGPSHEDTAATRIGSLSLTGLLTSLDAQRDTEELSPEVVGRGRDAELLTSSH